MTVLHPIGGAFLAEILDRDMRITRTVDGSLVGYTPRTRSTATDLRRLADSIDGGDLFR